MAIAIEGAVKTNHLGAATGGGLMNDLHTVTTATKTLLVFAAIEGQEDWASAGGLNTGCIWDIGGANSTNLTLIRETGNTGSNTDVNMACWALNPVPAPAVDANTRIDWQFNAAQACAIWVNLSGTVSSSASAAVKYVAMARNTTASASSVLAPGGTGGNSLFAFGVAQGNDMNPSSFSGFDEVIEGVSSATTSDFAYNFASKIGGAPAGTTMTWNTSDESTCLLIEVFPDAGASSIVPAAMHHYRNQGKVF